MELPRHLHERAGVVLLGQLVREQVGVEPRLLAFALCASRNMFKSTEWMLPKFAVVFFWAENRVENCGKGGGLQGYLTYKKTQLPRTLP